MSNMNILGDPKNEGLTLCQQYARQGDELAAALDAATPHLERIILAAQDADILYRAGRGGLVGTEPAEAKLDVAIKELRQRAASMQTFKGLVA